jgi:hypothetical protein
MPYARRQFRKARKFIRRNVVQKAKRRYTNNRGNVRLGKVIQDVQYIKSALNTERKHIEITMNDNLPVGAIDMDPLGNLTGMYGPARPTRTHVTLYPIPLPIRGVAYNQRVGNQVKFTYISARLQVEKANLSNYQSTLTWKCFIVWKKDGDTTLAPNDLLVPDANGAYTPMCYTNAEKFKQFYRPKYLTKTGRFTEEVSATPDGAPNCSYHYPRMSQKLSVQTKFELGSDSVCTQMRPYICFMSDDNQVHPTDNDHVDFTGTIRLSYVDN